MPALDPRKTFGGNHGAARGMSQGQVILGNGALEISQEGTVTLPGSPLGEELLRELGRGSGDPPGSALTGEGNLGFPQEEREQPQMAAGSSGWTAADVSPWDGRSGIGTAQEVWCPHP